MDNLSTSLSSAHYGKTASSSGRMIVLLLQTGLLIMSLAASVVAPTNLSKPFLFMCVMLATLSFVLQCIYKRLMPKPIDWFTVDILFSITFFLVHFWYYCSWITNINPSIPALWRDPAIVCYAAAMSASGMIVFLIGYNWRKEPLRSQFSFAHLDAGSLMRWKRSGKVIFYTALAITVGLIISVGRAYFEGSYAGTGSTVGFFMSTFILMMGIFTHLGFLIMLIAAGKMTGKWNVGIVATLLMLGFIGNTLVFGDRSEVFLLTTVMVTAYSMFVKAVSAKKIVVGMVLGVLVAGIGLIGRMSPDRTIASFVKTVREQADREEFTEGADNIAMSVRCINEAVRAVPAEYNYSYGKMKLSELASVFPYLYKILPIPIELHYGNSSNFLTWRIYGNLDSGVGTTVIADVYVDFGYPGVVIVLFLLGYLCKYSLHKARTTGSLVSGVAYCYMVAYVALMPRYAVTSLIRGVLWPLMAVLLLRFFLGIPKPSASAEDEYYDDEEEEYTDNVEQPAYPD